MPKSMFFRGLATLGLVAFVLTSEAASQNGFDLTDSLIPADEILRGGPPRDGIPSIDAPKFDAAIQAKVRDDERVLGVSFGGIAKAYPLSILNWHEIVNDRFGDSIVVVSFCPLCGTGVMFTTNAVETGTFGVSGLLYNSDLLLYDRKTHSLWSQILGKAVTGPLRGQRLEIIAAEHTRWGDWRERYPESLVLTRDTGFRRDYDRSPYEGYENQKGLYFPVQVTDNRYHPKEWVVGIEIDGKFKAFPFSELRNATQPVHDTVGGVAVQVIYDAEHDSVMVLDANGRLLPSLRAFWFAWVAFHPDTDVFVAP